MALVHAVTLACVLRAASLQHIPPVVILSLMKTEAGHVGGWTTNPNGSHDLGPMQINDQTWVPRIAKLQFGGHKREAEAALIYDGCYNVSVGAYIFRRYLNQAHGNYGLAVGYYNSHTPYYAHRYRVRFLHSLDQFVRQAATATKAARSGPTPAAHLPRAPDTHIVVPAVGVTVQPHHPPVRVAQNNGPPVVMYFPGKKP